MQITGYQQVKFHNKLCNVETDTFARHTTERRCPIVILQLESEIICKRIVTT